MSWTFHYCEIGSCYSGIKLVFQSLSSNSRFHATGHKDEDIIHIWPVTMFNFHGVLCDWSRGDLLIQAEPTGVLLCGWYANTGRIKCYFELEQYKPGDSISYPFLQSVYIYKFHLKTFLRHTQNNVIMSGYLMAQSGWSIKLMIILLYDILQFGQFYFY